MTVLSVAQNVALAVGLARPTAVYSSTERTWLEMQSVLNEAASEVAEAHDWQKLKRIATFTGNGALASFPLPAGYARMLKTASLWSSRFRWNLTHVVSTDDWLAMDTYSLTPAWGYWTIYGNEFHIRPTMASGETAKFFYIINQIVSGGASEFSDDNQTFELSERLLKLCTIYRWKQSKGQDFVAELSDYEIALTRAIDRDGGSKPVVTGNPHQRFGRPNVWPGTVSDAP